MRRIRILHSTVFTYSEPITETVMEVRLRPADGLGQRCLDFQLEVTPDSRLRNYQDGFGNWVHHFNHLPSHDRVAVISRSLVETGGAAGRPEEPEFADDLLLFRPPIAESADLHRFARRFGPVDPGSASRAAAALDSAATALREGFEYNSAATDVRTSVDEVLRLRAGVCQDFAHLLVGVARSLGIPARYVSGYVQEGDLPRLGASHAWMEAWLPGAGWCGWDATHPLRASDRHVRVAVGRDYRDAAPTRGVYVGAGRGTMEVTVEVAPG